MAMKLFGFQIEHHAEIDWNQHPEFGDCLFPSVAIIKHSKIIDIFSIQPQEILRMIFIIARCLLIQCMCFLLAEAAGTSLPEIWKHIRVDKSYHLLFQLKMRDTAEVSSRALIA